VAEVVVEHQRADAHPAWPRRRRAAPGRARAARRSVADEERLLAQVLDAPRLLLPLAARAGQDALHAEAKRLAHFDTSRLDSTGRPLRSWRASSSRVLCDEHVRALPRTLPRCGGWATCLHEPSDSNLRLESCGRFRCCTTIGAHERSGLPQRTREITRERSARRQSAPRAAAATRAVRSNPRYLKVESPDPVITWPGDSRFQRHPHNALHAEHAFRVREYADLVAAEDGAEAARRAASSPASASRISQTLASMIGRSARSRSRLLRDPAARSASRARAREVSLKVLRAELAQLEPFVRSERSSRLLLCPGFERAPSCVARRHRAKASGRVIHVQRAPRSDRSAHA
jgi:hypothetical protein